MNTTQLAQSAYARPDQSFRIPRDVEYEAFARVTHRLKQAGLHAEENAPAFVRAVYDNRHLWSLLAADVALPENGLPNDLRARIFSLAEFTRQHSRKVISGDAKIDILIEINTSIMRGLRHESSDA